MTIVSAIRTSVEQDGWFASAECLGADPDIFFIDKGGSTAEAKSICRRCPVKEQCLEYALENHELHGVWGGRSQSELRRIRVAMRRAARGQAQLAS
jgi:WhiB family redox-sensing transcriptional regulator